MTDKYTRMHDKEFGRTLRNADRKTYLWYKECSDNQLAALKGHPFYQDTRTLPQEKKLC